GFLTVCKTNRRPASIEAVRLYLATLEKQGKVAACIDGLRWFFRASREQVDGGANARAASNKPGRDRNAPTGRYDAGNLPEWEVALIQTLRLKGRLWRTEQSYRGWAYRFDRFLGEGATPRTADGGDVKRFLEDLVLRLNVGPSTQKQALNTIVFLMQ